MDRDFKVINQSLQSKFCLQSTDHHLKVSWFGDWFIVAANERQILPAQLEIQRAALPGLQVDLRETPQTLARRRNRSYQISNVELRDFLSRALSRIGQGHANRKVFVSGNRPLVQATIAVAKTRINVSWLVVFACRGKRQRHIARQIAASMDAAFLICF